MNTTITQRRHQKRWLRRFNKWVTNPIMRTFAGRRVYALVQHVGRRSGRVYSTPIVAIPTSTGFVIPLPYGDDTDWCRNIVSAGGCTLVEHGISYAVEDPTVLNDAQAAAVIPQRRRAVFRLFGIDQYLLVQRRAERAAAPPPGTL